MSITPKINIKILVAPLDWGLGHATRCIPLITELLKLGCKVIIAAEGVQENLLKQEFPDLAFVHLPGYRIKYSSTERFFSSKIILQLPKIFRVITKEKRWLKRFLAHTPVDAVISDNRYGFQHGGIPCIFITHQLLIKAPFALAERILQQLNYSLIQNFTACWIPDEKGQVNLGGELSHPKYPPKLPVEYLGGLSRLRKQADYVTKYDLLVILSGPEPQRTLLEKKMLAELDAFSGVVLFVRGLPGHEKLPTVRGNVTVKNHLASKELEAAFSSSDLIISRSGYTTLMDICKLQKRSILIPTPGQTEQEYLAKHFEQQRWAVSVSQQDFSLQKLLDRAERFEYKLPQLEMLSYKAVVEDFVRTLNPNL
ncbi:glycosyltransferase [Segetibacter aerophilus]|uniref:Glycosyl transferase n=1 Tax=Segetibacter aerophilus TaxID=670293 RepID=A0A512BJ34_9BACT|nr:glycosyltransferase [Segetibacter aerophilus]GEO11978.1 glycosyl transferase [Segetibacter aerophilus]